MLEGNPGFGAASNAGVAAARHAVTVLLNPDCELLDAGLAELAARAAGGEALLVPRLIEADGALQRSAHPLPGGPMALRARGAAHARAAPAPPRPPTAARGLGHRRVPGRRRPPCCVAWAPSTPARSSSTRTWTCACARTPPACRRSCTPRSWCAISAGAAPRASSAARPSTCRRAAVARSWVRASGRRALRYDDGAQALTFGLRAAVGRERGRNVAALRALRAARRMATAARS